jgi:DinB superfamily/Pentapeptide repeats (8 copies)
VATSGFPVRRADDRVADVATFSGVDDLQEATFLDVDLRRARFVGADLSGAVMRGVDVQGADIDAPWLSEQGARLVVNGVDVVPLVEAELDRRFPGRADRRAGDPDGLRTGWSRLQRTWAATLDRVAAMPARTVDTSVDGEWSFAQTLRHLVMATDVWLGRAVLERAAPYHPLGLPHRDPATDDHATDDHATDDHEHSGSTAAVPTWEEVLEARADRVAMVQTFLDAVTAEQLVRNRVDPWDPAHQVTVLHCLHVILNEEWDHHRYAVRDLDALAAGD